MRKTLLAVSVLSLFFACNNSFLTVKNVKEGSVWKRYLIKGTFNGNSISTQVLGDLKIDGKQYDHLSCAYSESRKTFYCVRNHEVTGSPTNQTTLSSFNLLTNSVTTTSTDAGIEGINCLK